MGFRWAERGAIDSPADRRNSIGDCRTRFFADFSFRDITVQPSVQIVKLFGDCCIIFYEFY